MSESSDEALLDRYFAGDAAAFRAFVRRHAGRVVAYGEAKGLRHELAAEVAQEAFLRLHRSIHGYRQGCPALPWFFTIVHHVVIDTLRKASSRREVATAQEDLDRVPSGTANGSAGALGTEALLGRLNTEQRKIVELRVFEGLSFAEMAEETGKAEPTLRKAFERARSRLRELLK